MCNICITSPKLQNLQGYCCPYLTVAALTSALRAHDGLQQYDTVVVYRVHEYEDDCMKPGWDLEEVI